LPPLGSLLRALSGVAGGVSGYLSADDEDERLLRTLGGAALGGVAIPATGAAGRRAWAASKPAGEASFKDVPRRLIKTLGDMTYFSLLSSPDTIARAGMGAIGGVLNGGFEKLMSGDFKAAGAIFSELTNAPKEFYELQRLSRSDPAGFLKRFRKTMGTEDAAFVPEAQKKQVLAEEVEQYRAGSGGPGTGLGKYFSIPDMMAVKALTAGGFDVATARRYTLGGTPKTKLGAAMMGGWKDARRGEYGLAGEVAATQLAPFARVGILGVEEGLKRIPGSGFFLKGEENLLGKQLAGGLAMGAGYASEDTVDPRIALTAGPLAGPAFLPFTLGREIRRSLRKGGQGENSLFETFQEFSPLGFRPGDVLTARGAASRAVPSIFADIAEAIDPAYGRETSPSQVRRAFFRGETPEWQTTPGVSTIAGRVPFLRETLPETFVPVDVYGRPRWPAETPVFGASTEDMPVLRGLMRTLAPSRVTAQPPSMPMRDALFRPHETFFPLSEAGVNLQPPSHRVDMGGLPMQQTPESAAAVQRLRGVSPQIASQIVAAVMSNPRFQNLNPAMRAYFADQLMQRFTRRLSRATSQAVQTVAASRGARRPALFS